MQISEKYRDKKIAILGYGIEGQATHEFLSKNGLKAEILDKKTNPNYLNNLKAFDVIFKTPGISPLTPELVAAERSGTTLTSQIEEFFELCPAPIIGITGTKGKGTTSTLIYDILKADGQDVYLGGNIGVPAISFLNKLSKSSIVVLELSSFQLQTLTKSPHIAVVLNITSEHLDYHQDVDEYRNAKSNIVNYQTVDDYLVVNDDYDVSREFASKTPANKFFFSKEHRVEGCYITEENEIILNVEGEHQILANASDLKLRGRHNLENVTAASLASYLAGAKVEVISHTVKNFSGLEHRLELVREVGGVKYYNDSFSTVPETAIAALDSFNEPIVLIAGGSNKNSDYAELGKKIAESNVKAIILIGEMAENIHKSIPIEFEGEVIIGLTKMDEIVTTAASLAKPGEVILLSPACASFGLFENYKDRGDQFKTAVKNL